MMFLGKLAKFMFIGSCSVAVLSVLSACTLLSPAPEPQHCYLLESSAVPLEITPPIKTKKTLVLSSLTVSEWLNTPRMAYQRQPNQLNYFAENQWGAPPYAMLQPVVFQALQQSGLYRVIINAPFSGNYDQRLSINITAMQQQFWQKPSVYHMTWEVQLLNNHTQKVIAATQLNANVPSLTDDPKGGVVAANQAVNMLIQQLLVFCQQWA